MCLINLGFYSHAKYKLIVAANRDEFYRRPTAPVHFWEDHPTVLAGRDLELMGTWMGITSNGRFAALTNYRDPGESRTGKMSRGEVVSGFLTGSTSPLEYLQALREKRGQYQGFNLVVGSADALLYYSNVHDRIIEIEPGIHGLSNHLLNTEWPKVVRGKAGLARCIEGQNAVDEKCLFSMLQDADPASDEELPKTGVSLEWERTLSPLFIQSPDYGTRSSTVITIDKENRVSFVEKTFIDGVETTEKRFAFQIAKRQSR